MSKLSNSLRRQIIKLRDNWLFLGIIIIIFVFISAANSPATFLSQTSFAGGYDLKYAEETAIARAPGYYGDDDFAPDVEDRLIIKTS